MFVFISVLDNVSSTLTDKRVQTVLSQCNECFAKRLLLKNDVFILSPQPIRHLHLSFKDMVA